MDRKHQDYRGLSFSLLIVLLCIAAFLVWLHAFYKSHVPLSLSPPNAREMSTTSGGCGRWRWRDNTMDVRDGRISKPEWFGGAILCVAKWRLRTLPVMSCLRPKLSREQVKTPNMWIIYWFPYWHTVYKFMSPPKNIERASRHTPMCDRLGVSSLILTHTYRFRCLSVNGQAYPHITLALNLSYEQTVHMC